jgi:hypothetical protein
VVLSRISVRQELIDLRSLDVRQQPHLDQAWVAIFVEHDVPIAALERVECKVYLMDGEIGYTAGSEDDDLISLISAAAGH